MDHSSRNQGELSLLDLIESIKSPDGNKERPSATLAIALNDEKHRREECEKSITQLQQQITALQSDRCVAEAALQRKDSLLMQAQQQWRNREEDWKHKLTNSNEEKERLTAAVSALEERVQTSLGEVRRLKMEIEATERKNDETVRGLQNDNKNLKEVNEVCQSQLQEANSRLECSVKETKKIDKKLDELKRENHHLKNQLEEINKEKNNLTVELELFQERYEASRQQWEQHYHARILETKRESKEEAERQLQDWQIGVDSKLQHLVRTLEQQLGALKAKNLEEVQENEKRHQMEINQMKSHCSTLQLQIQQQQKEHELLTQRMRQLVEAQWNAVNGLTPAPVVMATGTRPTATPVVTFNGISDAASLSSELTTKTSSTLVTKRNELHQYVNQVISRHHQQNVPTSSTAAKVSSSRQRSDSAHQRKT